jgi:steroid 5-alpha reductase family enzyme
MSPFERAALAGLAVSGALAVATWLASLQARDASLVDRTWSVLVAAPAVAYAAVLDPPWNVRTLALAALLAAWALRLAVFITRRNRGHGEDPRYQAIRARNEPGFAFKSLYLVFLLQAVLAWLVSAPLLGVFAYDRGTSWLDLVGAAIVATGLVLEAVADAQLARFRRDPANRGRVMDQGLWRWSRHPNYFGEFCVWWGFFVMALPLAAWSVVSPLLMSVLLLKVSGVALLEKDIGARRPAYRDYVRRTSAFLPWPPRRGS